MPAKPQRTQCSHKAQRKAGRLCVAWMGLLSASCLSLNDQFNRPALTATDASDPKSDATSPTIPGNTSEIEDEVTLDPRPSSTVEEPTSVAQTTSQTSTGDQTSSGATTSTSSTSISSTGSSSSTGSTSEPDPGPQRCQNPTLCFEANAGRSINRLAMATFDSFALRFPRQDESLNVARVDVYTGSLLGTHSISLHPEQQDQPGAKTRTEFFSATVIQRWYATSFDPPVEVSSRAPHWISWSPPSGSLGSSALFGQRLQGKQKLFASSSWATQDYPIMMRVYCCP